MEVKAKVKRVNGEDERDVISTCTKPIFSVFLFPLFPQTADPLPIQFWSYADSLWILRVASSQPGFFPSRDTHSASFNQCLRIALPPRLPPPLARYSDGLEFEAWPGMTVPLGVMPLFMQPQTIHSEVDGTILDHSAPTNHFLPLACAPLLN
jgi:hypothetical protein